MRKTFLEKCINLRLCRVALVLLFLVPAISNLQANPSQNKTISGVVTSATDSEPLIGVSVQVRETATGGITDIDGRYSVSAQQGQTLVFSYIGYQSQGNQGRYFFRHQCGAEGGHGKCWMKWL